LEGEYDNHYTTDAVEVETLWLASFILQFQLLFFIFPHAFHDFLNTVACNQIDTAKGAGHIE
jgi:hypothetical protein